MINHESLCPYYWMGDGSAVKGTDQCGPGKIVDTNDEWIRSRTGIRQRYIVGEEESTATLAKK
jgi:3-oxoacyl-[acyl-carrier-protein] synthase-3